MMQPTLLLLAIIACFELARFVFGPGTVYEIGYGAFSILAAVIALTFLWLWWKRSTPLALGMAFGWAGSASVMAWWWMYNHFDAPEWMLTSPALYFFLSVYFVGAIMHLEVIGRSFGYSRKVAIMPVVVSILLSVLVTLVV